MAAQDAELGALDSSDVSALLREAEDLQLGDTETFEEMDEAAIDQLLQSAATGGDDGLPAGHSAVAPELTEMVIA
jgi:hypothetical protein